MSAGDSDNSVRSPGIFARAWSGARRIGAVVWAGLGRAAGAFGSVFRWPVSREAPLGVSAIAVWLMLFTAGMAVNSSAFTNALESTVTSLQQPLDPIGRLINLVWGLVLLVLILFTYTASNVALLCLLSAEIGVFAARMYESSQRGVAEVPLLPSRYLAALAGGFLIYLIVMSGSYTLLNLPFQTPNVGELGVERAQSQYKTLATLASIACLIEGFQPFAIPAVNRWLRGRSGADEAGSRRDGLVEPPGDRAACESRPPDPGTSAQL
jgi:hypothetical protein